jgi:hypothetical protein
MLASLQGARLPRPRETPWNVIVMTGNAIPQRIVPA